MWVWWDRFYALRVVCTLRYDQYGVWDATNLSREMHETIWWIKRSQREQSQHTTYSRKAASGSTRALAVSLIYSLFCFFSVVLSSKRIQIFDACHRRSAFASGRVVLCCVSAFHSSSSMPKWFASLIHGNATTSSVCVVVYTQHSTPYPKARGKRRYVYK